MISRTRINTKTAVRQLSASRALRRSGGAIKTQFGRAAPSKGEVARPAVFSV